MNSFKVQESVQARRTKLTARRSMLMGALLDAAVDSFVWASAVAIFLGEALLHDAALHGSWSDATQATNTLRG
ncbi:Hypothetical Protein FCC1311_047602 [Hondaea fermentalgiana]|uniref:Uncharacterized protein n=1 Tax=Hondaea fermentalgiana TaxID=2315210 RepID=A0A2R5GC25_9STRA|nr:Hypothetical Protein FCC1311_047602 [Hondaea fermentalgiana]|eukprot:GBG28537.1 Hypothetical Protein FCC1311_047602 [Hondaea fermentalgiana]